jgi:hypothetical protein
VIRLWLPLTLLWIILAPFALVAAPALALAPGTRRLSPIRAALGAGRLLLALSGTLIEVDSPAAVIRIHIDALGSAPVAGSPLPTASRGAPKYFRVEVDAHDPGEAPTKVNVRIPMQLLRAGVRLSSLIPSSARDEINLAMAKQGFAFDINQLKPENLEDLIEHLSDFSVDVDNEDAKVRVYCE